MKKLGVFATLILISLGTFSCKKEVTNPPSTVITDNLTTIYQGTFTASAIQQRVRLN